LLQKPDLPTPHFEPADDQKVKRADVFKPPYNPNLYVGELRDEEEGTEYAVLVSWVILSRLRVPLLFPGSL
jgi:ATP adenylyltransferase